MYILVSACNSINFFRDAGEIARHPTQPNVPKILNPRFFGTGQCSHGSKPGRCRHWCAGCCRACGVCPSLMLLPIFANLSVAVVSCCHVLFDRSIICSSS